MFDIDSGKLLIVAVLALIVIGPKELPRVLRQVGQAVGKMRRMATEFQGQFMDAMKEADIADIRKELDELNSKTALDFDFNPVRDVQSELTGMMKAADPVVGAADTAVMSPAADFALPPTPAPSEAESMGALAEGIAPVAEPALAHTALINGAHALEIERSPVKRRIVVKRRRSNFNLLRSDQAAWTSGEPLVVQRRMVRPKEPQPLDAPRS